MKKFKILFTSLLMFLISAFAFAYDGTILGGKDGNFSRKVFNQDASDEQVARGIIKNISQSLEIDSDLKEFFQVTPENLDKEDAQMIEDVENYIKANNKVANNDGFSYLVVRGNNDGWLVLSHYSEKESQPWWYYVYYFAFND